MANLSSLQGNCIAPFLDASLFPAHGGFLDGRFCAPVPLPGNPTCCVPCPATDWIYSDNFNTNGQIAEWLNVVGLVLMIFMLVSYMVLPAQKTRSHYLSVCLIVAVMFIAIGFTIPLAAQPDQCYDEITPNDMYSSAECAWSGSFIVAGGLCATMWIFIRALSMNLQICWDIIPGRKFFYFSQAVGWGVPAALFTATMTMTGVSFRFGSACHVNHATSMQDFWGPLMAFAAAAGILQLATFGYCIHVYLKNLWSDTARSSTGASDSGLPSYSSSVSTQTARAVYQRLKKVLWLQWRGICIVSIIFIDVVFFSTVFVYLDGLQTYILKDWHEVEPWLTCLALNPHNKDACLHLTNGWLVNESTAMAVLFLLSMTGIQCFLFLTRPSVFPAWAEFLRAKFSPHRQEFVSLDARSEILRTDSKQQLMQYERGHQSTMFEMQDPGLKALRVNVESISSPTPTVLSSPSEAYRSPLQHGRDTSDSDDGRSISPTFIGISKGRIPSEYAGRVTPTAAAISRPVSPLAPPVSYNATTSHQLQSRDCPAQHQRQAYARETSSESLGRAQVAELEGSRPQRQRRQASEPERRYQPHRASFSTPMTASRQSSIRGLAFSDPREGYGRGGLGLHPPSEKGESREELGFGDGGR